MARFVFLHCSKCAVHTHTGQVPVVNILGIRYFKLWFRLRGADSKFNANFHEIKNVLLWPKAYLVHILVKVNVTPWRRGGGGDGCIAPTHSQHCNSKGGWFAPRCGRFTLVKDLVPIVQEALWPLGWVGRGQEISPPAGFDSWTVLPVESNVSW
jgi:hypothetical protein